MLTVRLGTEQNKALAVKERFVSPIGLVKVSRIILILAIAT